MIEVANPINVSLFLTREFGIRVILFFCYSVCFLFARINKIKVLYIVLVLVYYSDSFLLNAFL